MPTIMAHGRWGGKGGRPRGYESRRRSLRLSTRHWWFEQPPTRAGGLLRRDGRWAGM